MITPDMYQASLRQRGKNLSQVRRSDSAMVMNATFTGDVGYKRVYILDRDKGWVWTDAKYSKHATESILRDAVDYYLQFRPFEHHPVGSYVFIPNDESDDIGFSEESPVDPFKDPNFIDPSFDIENKCHLWLIVGRNDEVEFVRYSIIKCNWNFKWVYRIGGVNRIMSIFGAIRIQSSYTSGDWTDEYTVQFSNVAAAWVPDTALILGEDCKEKFGIEDTRFMVYEKRFMLTTNKIQPRCYEVTKIVDTAPKGVIKYTFKQDEFDPKRDNNELLICNYYNDSGEIQVDEPTPVIDPTKTSVIYYKEIQPDGSMVKKLGPVITKKSNLIYFEAETSSMEDIYLEWRTRLTYSPTEDLNKMTDEKKQYYCNLLKITIFSNSEISLRVANANGLIGKKFELYIEDQNGDYYSKIELEVTG